MNFLKIPKDSNAKGFGGSQNKIIGVIDASGSMQGNWEWLAKMWNDFIPAEGTLTLTFDTKTRVCASNRLDKSISKHGGGGTNITGAFDYLENELAKIPKDVAITVIFISDGQDNNLSTLESRFKSLKGNQTHALNFICLGVGSGFPTFLSMRLREKYHKGDETLPAIFLIEYVSEKAYLNKFESIKPFLSYNRLRTIKPAVLSLPWREYTTQVYENSWIMTDADKVEIDGVEMDASKYKNSLDGVVEIFRSWTQMIHLDSLQASEDIKDRALKTQGIMEDIIAEIKEAKGIDLLDLNSPSKVELSFYQRALNNFLKHTASRAAWFYEDIKLLAAGKAAKDLNEFDAAKKIGLGTVVGKYHQRAFALKGFTVEEFQQTRDKFKEIFMATKLDSEKSGQASPLTHQNQKKIFLESDFLKGLEMCNTQFDLIESFPVWGFPMRLKRYEGSKENPWLTEVKLIVDQKPIDSIEVLKAAYALELKVDGKTETINAVLPLFDKHDADLFPIVSSRFHHLLMSYNVVLNVDVLFEEAYLSLLANALIYALGLPESDWRDRLLQAIHISCNVVYGKDVNFLKYQEGLTKDPALCIAKDEEQLRFGSIDLSKALLHAFILKQENKVTEEKLAKIFDAIYQGYVLKIMKDKDTKIESYLKVKTQGTSIEAVKKLTREKFNTFITKGDFRRGIYTAFEKEAANPDQYIFEWDVSPLEKADDKVNLKALETLTKALGGKIPTKEEYIKYIVLGVHCKDLVDCYASKDINVHELTGKLGKKLTLDITKGGVSKLPQCQEVIKALEPEFEAYFKDIHREIIPISEKDLKEHCSKTKTAYDKYQWLANSDLLRNACLAPKCPFYLQLNNHLGHHLAIWEKGLPIAFHKTVKKFAKMDAEEIYQHFAHGDCLKKNSTFAFTPEAYDTTKEATIAYIKKLQEVYLHIGKN